MQNIKFNENFYLSIKDVKTLNEVQLVPKSHPTNFIFVIDVSGSMYGELGFIRQHLKNKLPLLVKDGDTVTVIWFSGRNEAGILMEDVEIRSLKKLQDINTAIDRFLKPIGLTAFHKPLVLAKQAIEKMKKSRKNDVFSLIFLTDGYNNDCSWSDVTKSLKELEPDLAGSTFVEYGYYADSNAIAKMAELVGGEKIEAEQFDEYDVVFENKIQKTYGSSKKILVDVPAENRIFDFVFTVSPANEIILYGVNDNQVYVPEDTISLYWFTNKPSSSFVFPYENKPELNKLVYTSLYVLTEKLQNDYADDIFKVLGDKNLYEVFTNAYGKQKLFAFKNMVKECVFDNTKQFLKGRVANLVMDENAYCVMNFIDDLTSDENALIYPMHEAFTYKRIGAKKVAADNGELSEDQKELLAGAKNVDELKRLTEEIAAKAQNVVKFEYKDKTKGYPISNLIWSSDRANLSINVRYDGYVNLPENEFGLDRIDTFIFRNYTIIKDGILNITQLPLTLSPKTVEKFRANGVDVKENQITVVNGQSTYLYVVDFSLLPVINRKMVKSISAEKLAEMEFELLKIKGLAKVYKYYEELHFPKKVDSFSGAYSEEATKWLAELGITSYNGFNPKMVTEKGSDFYMAVELNTKIAKYSAIPAVNAVLKKIAEGKPLNVADELLKPAIDDYETQINSSIYKSLTDDNLKKDILKNWLKGVNATINVQRKKLIQEIAQIKFSLILSKKWFEEFKSFDEDTLVQNIDGKDLTFKFELSEKKVNV